MPIMYLWPGLHPGPHWGPYRAPQTPSWIYRATSCRRGEGEEGEERNGREGEKRRGEWRGL